MEGRRALRAQLEYRLCVLSRSVRIGADMDGDMERLKESHSCEHYAGNAGYLLFVTESGVFPFVKYEEQLAKINDYCLYLLICLKEKVDTFEPFDIDEHDWAGPVSWEHSQFLSWSFLYEEINKYTLLLLLLAFFESVLSEIANWFSDITGNSQWKKVRNPKVSDYIRQIGMCCRADLQDSLADELAYYDSIRKIRNQFVHHTWEQMTDQHEKFALADVINMISRVIAGIEQSALAVDLI